MVAKVNGVHHAAMAVSDMSAALELFRDILGMGLKAAGGGGTGDKHVTGLIVEEMAMRPARMYNLDMGRGAVLTLVEIKGARIEGRRSGFAEELWPGQEAPGQLGGVDHLSFQVDSEADLVEIHAKLRTSGYLASDIQRLQDFPWWKQFFFYDRDGNALEVSTWDWDSPEWKARGIENPRAAVFNTDSDSVW